MSNTIPFFTRDIANYRHWLRYTNDPEELRKIALCICYDLEEAKILIENLSASGAIDEVDIRPHARVIHSDAKDYAW